MNENETSRSKDSRGQGQTEAASLENVSDAELRELISSTMKEAARRRLAERRPEGSPSRPSGPDDERDERTEDDPDVTPEEHGGRTLH